MIIETKMNLPIENEDGEGLSPGEYNLFPVCFQDINTREETRIFMVKGFDFYLLRETILIMESLGMIEILKGSQMLWT